MCCFASVRSNRTDRVAQHGGDLEVLALGAARHASPQARQQLDVLAAEEHLHVLDLLRIGRRGDVDGAWARAPLDLVLEARSTARLEDVIGARAQLEVPVQRAERLAREVAEW